MTEIEKMFEKAGFPKKQCKDYSCIVCEQNNNCEKYPPFTTEKQTELIKLLGGIKDYIVEIDKFKGVYYIGCREAGSNNKHWGSHNFFEEALAELINHLWQSLTDQEKEEIRNILNG